jgi:ParB family chromosome partitioning protein
MSAKNVEPVVENGTEIFIPLSKLKKSPKNARKTPHSEAAIEAYAASIAAKGILQNLVVEPELDAEGAATGFYFVTIGEGRRLAQLLRVKRKEIKKTEPIRCIVDTTNDPHEISLDENVTRENMHPADQFEAFKKLADERFWCGRNRGPVRRDAPCGAAAPAVGGCLHQIDAGLS